MRIHILRHEPFDDAATIVRWAKARGFSVSTTRFYAADPLPRTHALDALVVMGGTMNVYQYREFPWLMRERDFLWDAVEKRVPTLGICLGAQLLADVLGGSVRRNRHQEIGWHRVTLTEEARALPLFDAWPPELTVFQWHEDTFDLPFGAVRLAYGSGCENQGFVYKERAIGIQFHPEMSRRGIRALMRACAHAPLTGPFVQTPAEMLAGMHLADDAQRLLFGLLERLCDSRAATVTVRTAETRRSPSRAAPAPRRSSGTGLPADACG